MADTMRPTPTSPIPGTTTIFPEYGITQGVTVEEPAQLFVRGSILRGKWSDAKSPILRRMSIDSPLAVS